MNAINRFATAVALLFTFGVGAQSAVADLLPIYETFPTRPKVSVLGDSYSTFAGSQPEGYAVYYKDGKNGITDRSMVYWAQFVAAMGGTLEVNNSWSGSLVSRHPANTTTPMIDAARLANLGDPDILLLFGGTNDAWSNAPRGESLDCYDPANWTEENLVKFRPAYAYLLNWLLTNKPGTQIIAIINTTDDVGNMFGAPGLRTEYADDIREIAAHYGVLSVQLAGISKSDGHPDVRGHKAIGEQIMRAYRMRELAGGAKAETAAGTRVQKAYPAVVGTRTSDADGFQRIVHDTDANVYYRVVAVTNPNCFATYSLPANAMVEYLAVGGGAAGGAAGISAAVCGGNAGVVRDGFLLTKAACEVVVKVGDGGEPTTGSSTNLGRPGGATYFRLGNSDIIEAAGGLPKPVETAASASYGGTGGDGAGGAGTQATSAKAGCGGAAVLRYTTGEKAAYAGGGTGWKRSASSHGTGGAAGGITVGGYLIGTASAVTDDSHKNGVANTGSGGAAGSVANGNFSVGSGADGIAVFRYAVAAPENAVDEEVEVEGEDEGEGEEGGEEPGPDEPDPEEPDDPPSPSGKLKVSIIGDSYSATPGTLPSGNVEYSCLNIGSYSDRTYWYKFIAALGGTLEVNQSWSGSLVSNYRPQGNTTTSMIDDARLGAIGNPDIILLFGGTNDAWNNAPRGDGVDCYDPASWTEDNLKTFRPAYAYLINRLQTLHPGVEIICLINTTSASGAKPDIPESMAADIEEIAAHYQCLSVRFHDIAKYSNHPDAKGNAAMFDQLWQAYKYASVPGVEATAVAASGTPTATTAVRVANSLTNTPWGAHWILRQGDDCYQVVAVTQTAVDLSDEAAAKNFTWTIPANKTVEYFAVGGGAAGSSTTVAASVCGGGAGEVKAGFFTTLVEVPVAARAGAGGVPSGVPGTPGAVTYFRVGNAATVECAGGVGKANASGNLGGTGGDGAGGEGTVATTEIAGCGGAAVLSYITGEKAAYAGGGTGWKRGAGSHGAGGAADGITVGGYLIGTSSGVTDDSHKNGVANTGSGGAAGNATYVGSGADGIVVFRYLIEGVEGGGEGEGEQGEEPEEPGPGPDEPDPEDPDEPDPEDPDEPAGDDAEVQPGTIGWTTGEYVVNEVYDASFLPFPCGLFTGLNAASAITYSGTKPGTWSPANLIDGSIWDGAYTTSDYGKRCASANGTSVTIDLGAAKDLYNLRFLTYHGGARNRINISSVKVVYADSTEEVLTSVDPNYGGTAKNGYFAWLKTDTGSPLATNVTKVVFTWGQQQNNAVSYAEIEATDYPFDVPGAITAEIALNVDSSGVNVLVTGAAKGLVESAKVYYATSESALADLTTCASVAADLTPVDDYHFTYTVRLPKLAHKQYYMRAASFGNGKIVKSNLLTYDGAEVGIGTGGEISAAADGSGDVIHVFTDTTSAAAFTAPSSDISVRYLVLGGGGSGASGRSGNPNGFGGGGGGGGLVEGTLTVSANAVCPIVVGKGGVAPTADDTSGANGGNSSLTVGATVFTGIGGGGGGTYKGAANDGGNGGGGGSESTKAGAATQRDASGETLVGFVGGIVGGGGGAGASGASVTATSTSGANGGNGKSSDITGETVVYGGGGGSGGKGGNAVGAGGAGGGGTGGNKTTSPKDGENGLGGGGGGGGNAGIENYTDGGKARAGNGGSGIVILRYHPARMEAPKKGLMVIFN